MRRVTLVLATGGSLTTTTEKTLEQLQTELPEGRPRWLTIGDVVVYSQNIVAIQPATD